MTAAQPPHGQRRKLLAYFILAYAFSWSIGIPLALEQQGVIPPVLPMWTHYLVAYGPMLAAVVVTWRTEGKAGLVALGQRLLRWRVHPFWWGVALSPLMIGGVVALFLKLLTTEPITLAALGNVNFLPPLGLGALALWLFTFGIGEEIGWRGYALPRLQKGRSALAATTLLTIGWALWHLPQFFYVFEPAIAIGWAIGLFAGALVFTWLFNSTGGSVLLLAIWHGCFNFITASTAGNGLLAAIVSALVMVWAVVVVVKFKPATLSQSAKVVA